MKFQDNIKKLKRIQTSQNRDLLSGINLDRNEKVDLFDLRIQKKIKKIYLKIYLILLQMFQVYINYYQII